MSDTPDNLNPHDSFARRLNKALQRDGAPADARPDVLPAPPASQPAESPALFDSYAGRLENALKRSPRKPGESPQQSGPPGRANGTVRPPTETEPGRPLDTGGDPDQSATDETAAYFDSYSRRLGAVLRNSASDQASEASGDPPPPESQGPVGAGEHVVKPGECVSSIAKDAGHFWETLWNDPANAQLRNEREDPNVLLPDDRLHIPPIREKWEPRQTEQRHRFRRRGEPALLRLVLQVDDVPLANQAYTLEIDGERYQGTTDAQGQLVQGITPNAKHGRLIVGAERWEFEIQLGHTDPVENLVGVQKRLANLGFYCGRMDGEWDDLCRSELRKFQKQHGLAETGEPDAITRDKLKSVHGS